MIETAIAVQVKWIAEHGGDLEGYRRNYAGLARKLLAEDDPDLRPHPSFTIDADAIYYADINYLWKLRGVPDEVINQENAERILGEGYFA